MQHTASEVNSLAHFQRHSRLHFIGQWRTKAEDLLRSWYFGSAASALHRVRRTEDGAGPAGCSVDAGATAATALTITTTTEGASTGASRGDGRSLSATSDQQVLLNVHECPGDGPNSVDAAAALAAASAAAAKPKEYTEGLGGTGTHTSRSAHHPEWYHGLLQQQAIFVHVDMDAYFCAVALSKPENAHLQNKPVCIAAGKNRSDVSSCNYIARERGVSTRMWVGEAKARCPDLVILNYDLPRCEQLNEEIYRVLLSSCPLGTRMSLEVYSVDDTMIAFDNPSFDVALQYCAQIRDRILHVTNGCTASCGIGKSILVARLATALAKPNGVRAIHPEEVDRFIAALPITELHGVGPAAQRKITELVLPLLSPQERQEVEVRSENGKNDDAYRDDALSDDSQNDEADVGGPPPQEGHSARLHLSHRRGMGHHRRSRDAEERAYKLRCEHLRRVSLKDLQAALGAKNGEALYNHCRGHDSRVVRRTGDIDDQLLLGRSLSNAVGCTMNYAVRPDCLEDVAHLFTQLSEDVAAKLRRINATCSVLRVTILERHPEYPRVTTKYMGCGRCVEQHFPLKLGRPLSGDESGEMVSLIRKLLSRILLVLHYSDSRALNVPCGMQCNGDFAAGEVAQITASERIRREALTKERRLLVDVLDVRGVGLQASGLQSVMKKKRFASAIAEGASSRHTLVLPKRTTTTSRALGGDTSHRVQISLTAAFSRARARARVGQKRPRPGRSTAAAPQHSRRDAELVSSGAAESASEDMVVCSTSSSSDLGHNPPPTEFIVSDGEEEERESRSPIVVLDTQEHCPRDSRDCAAPAGVQQAHGADAAHLSAALADELASFSQWSEVVRLASSYTPDATLALVMLLDATARGCVSALAKRCQSTQLTTLSVVELTSFSPTTTGAVTSTSQHAALEMELRACVSKMQQIGVVCVVHRDLVSCRAVLRCLASLLGHVSFTGLMEHDEARAAFRSAKQQVEARLGGIMGGIGGESVGRTWKLTLL